MLDIHLWGAFIAPIIYFLFIVWLITPFYDHRKKDWRQIITSIGEFNIVKRLILFIIVTAFILTFGSAYRPKNTLVTLDGNYGQNRVDTKIVTEKPRYNSFDEKVENLESVKINKEKDIFDK